MEAYGGSEDEEEEEDHFRADNLLEWFDDLLKRGRINPQGKHEKLLKKKSFTIA